jgi:DNA repair protein RadC
MGVHDGHRARVRQRVLEEGIAHLPVHNVLEILLFFSRPRGDTNELAHRILDRYHGDLAAVCDAPYEDLLSVEGVGENTAFLLKLLPQLSAYYRMARIRDGLALNCDDAIREYFIPMFYGKHNEELHIVCLDTALRPISEMTVSEGSLTAAPLNIRRIVEAAINSHAAAVVMAHNHPSGTPYPSRNDVVATQKVKDALELVDVVLVDHIIVAEEGLCSFKSRAIPPFDGFPSEKTQKGDEPWTYR